MTATCNFVSLGDKMRELLVKNWKRKKKVRWPKSVTAISICTRQFQFAHGSFNFNFAHGSFNFAHGSFNLLTAVSICSRQFQFAHDSFNFAHDEV